MTPPIPENAGSEREEIAEVIRLAMIRTDGYQQPELRDAIADAILARAPAAGTLPDVLSCDVMLPPATIIRKGCSIDTLMTALRAREKDPLYCPHFAPATRPAATPPIPTEQQLQDIVDRAWKKNGVVPFPLYLSELESIARDIHAALSRPDGCQEGK